MGVHTGELRLSTRGDGDVIDLTGGVEDIVEQSGVSEGVVSVFVPGSTAAITAMEFEPGGVHDLRDTLERLIPREGRYEHNRLNHDTNSHAHIRAAMLGPSETRRGTEGGSCAGPGSSSCSWTSSTRADGRRAGGLLSGRARHLTPAAEAQRIAGEGNVHGPGPTSER